MPIKVNVDKLLADYNYLSAKQKNKLAEIEVEARAYAAKRGFDEEKTAETIDVFQSLENNGLSDDDAAKFNLLDEYIEEVDETVAEETAKADDDVPTQPANPIVPNPAAVNVL